MTRKKAVSLLITVLILGAAFVPLPDVYADTADGSQSSFEYKNYADQDAYKSALDIRMHRVYSSIGGAIDDAATIPIPGLVSTHTKTGGQENESSQFVPQGICQAEKYILITAYHSKKKQNSVIYVVDTENNSLVSTLTLPNKYHLGGIAFDGNNIWITGATSDKYKGDPFVQYIRFEDFAGMIEEADREVRQNEISDPMFIKNKPSFLECDNGILWVGTYIGRESSKKGFMNGYKITEKEDGPELNTFMYSVISGIDSSVQGVDIKDGNLYVSSSYGGSIGAVKSSFITRYNFTDGKNGDRDINISKKEVKRVEVPKMNEEILVTDSGIIINFEAAADCWKSVVIATDRLLAVGNSLWR